jgi:hypothetical protein
MRSPWVLCLTSTLTLLSAASAFAASYTIHPIAKFGDRAGRVLIPSGVDAGFEIGSLNNAGDLIFVTEDSAGGEALVLSSNDSLEPLVIGGADAPGGQWPSDVQLLSPVSMNQFGNVGFTANVDTASSPNAGTFLWDAAAGQFTAIAMDGMPLEFGLTFDPGGDWLTIINNSNEIAFTGTVVNPQGQTFSGAFFQRRDGQLVPVALPGDMLNENRQIVDATAASLNDAGIVAFTARLKDDPASAYGAYRWELGQRTMIATMGTPLPGGQKIASVLGAWVNNANRNVLLAVTTDPDSEAGGVERPVSLYLWNAGALMPVAVPGQTMPDGGQLVSIQDFGVSAANDLGEHAFLAVLAGGATAAYRMDADGKLSLVLKSGMETAAMGTIDNVGQGAGTSSGISLNRSGQIAVTLQVGFDVDTIALLTPTGS